MTIPGTDLAGIPDGATTPLQPRPLRSGGSTALAGAVVVLGVTMVWTPWVYATVLVVLVIAQLVMRGWRGLRSGSVVPAEIWTTFVTAMAGWVTPILGTALYALAHLGDHWSGAAQGGVFVGVLAWPATVSRTYSAARRWVTWHTDPQQLVIEAANEAVGRGRDGIN